MKPRTQAKGRKGAMTTRRFQVERVEIDSGRSFEDLVKALERKVPAADFTVFQELVTSGANASDVERRVQSMVGDLGFLVLGKVDQGPLVSLLGRPKKLTTYLIGNPVLANRMFEQHPAVGLYAPVRVVVYQDHEGRCHVSYDRPSTLLAQFEDDRIRGVGELLDERLAALADYLATDAKGERS